MVVFGVFSILIGFLPAHGDVASYPTAHRYRWTPDNGWVQSGNSGRAYYNRFVNEMVMWRNWPGLQRLDYPRTPSHFGVYEHELRFLDNYLTGRRYCDYYYGPHNIVSYLPNGYYFDTVDVDRGEFTWGFPAWRITLNYGLQIQFDCAQTPAINSSGSVGDQYFLTGQLGHCHAADACTSGNTYSDEQKRLIPTRQSVLPGVRHWYAPFSRNESLEAPPGSTDNDFSTYGGGATQDCSGGFDSCFWRIVPSSTSSNAVLFVDYGPIDPPELGTASVYSEFVVRCDNAGVRNCVLRLVVRGFNAGGVHTQAYATPWNTILDDGTWYAMPSLITQAFPTGTVKWRFELEGAAGHYYSADYHRQFWHLPAGYGGTPIN